MARQLIWRRNSVSFAQGTEVGTHTVQGAFLNPGETLTRLRFRWIAYHTADIPADGVGFAIGLGAIVVPDSVLAPDLPRPLANPNEDWLWWEAPFFNPETLKSDATNVVNEIDMAPPDGGGERDVKAQRLSTTVGGDRLWFISEGDTISVPQTEHFLSVSFSAGILLPP